MATTRRRPPRRRVWPKIRLLLLICVVAAGATALYPVWKAANPDPPELTVRYRTDTPDTAEVAKPSIEVLNDSKKPLPLADVTLRYYFTADGDSPYAFNCVQAAVGCSNISGTVTKLDKSAEHADHYLELRFTQAAGTLKPGGNSKGIDVQLFRADHKELDQSNDRSFDGEKTTYKSSKTVTAYKRGVLAWGDEPDSGGEKGASAKASAAPAPVPDAPAGVLFDNFNYTGAKDPALFKHGWLVRSSKGGPGIDDTWSADGVTFPGEKDALAEGQVLNLRASTDGTKSGTRQASLGTASREFRSGTYAARIHFSDDPTEGEGGDHVNQTFYTIGGSGKTYSELDNEYLPNGGWGRLGPKLDTVSWYDHESNDRVYTTTNKSLAGWHTMMITVKDDVVTYRMDGKKLFTSSGKYAPRSGMSVNFNHWFVDLPFKGDRAWDMKVDWLYYNAKDVLTVKEVDTAVKEYSDNGMNYFDTVQASR
ncbi:cellulose binding domain-containing protein [Streptomyces sp. NL15-2K]|uniref:cellulose binding domain-containing protein n=1 Tax=Streptomyces sp. NL15-2K TaxID=376149 RepID=UPI000F567D73|nr:MULTISPECIES: cellulose binding domain-containing protein [Actinomycetes]WKX13345.1 cellulose binding domain-containing protein [Kutzneria buriramensis]GCB45283.1 hydrolase [Streptomyces sp. NL15-2K]